MKEFVDKLIERLEEKIDGNKKYTSSPMGNDARNQIIGLKKAIEIVNQVASEYCGGWIPCSERLPEDDRDVLVVMSDGSMMVDFRTASSSGWFWSDNDDMPLAWHELPQPYQPKGEQL